MREDGLEQILPPMMLDMRLLGQRLPTEDAEGQRKMQLVLMLGQYCLQQQAIKELLHHAGRRGTI